MSAVYTKELSSYFKNPLGYICLAVYYLFGGQFLLMQIQYYGTNDITGIFSNMYVVALLTLPLFTMRLLSEEKRMRTDQALMTAPVSLHGIVVGKFLAAYTLFALGISVCVIYFAVLSAFSSPLWSVFLGNLLGLLLLGAALLAIGLFVSALTESQMLAAVGTFACMLFIMLLDGLGRMLPSGLSFLEKPLGALSFSQRYYDFTAGLLKLPHVVFFLSVMLVFLFLTVRVLDKNRWTASKRIKNAAVSTVVTIFFLAVVVLFNVVFSLLMERLPSMDLTEGNIYELTEDSLDVVESLTQPVEIIVCHNEEDLRSTEYGKQTDEILKGYARHNAGIQVRFADLLKEPELAAEYADYGIQNNSIIIKSEKRIKMVSLNDCVEMERNDSSYSYTYKSKAEQVLTSAILYVTEDSVLRVSVLTGHSEAGCADIINYLEENNYVITRQNIAAEEINPEAEIAFLFAPMTDYTQQELEKLDRFLDNEGKFEKKLIYVASHNQPKLPNLESFLSEWGIGIGNSLIVETNQKNTYDKQGFMFGAVFDEAAQPYLSGVKNPSLLFVGYYCRPLSVLWEEKDNRTAKYLVKAPESCSLYQPDTGEVNGENPLIKEELGIVVIGDRLKYVGTQEHRSYVAAFASAAMFTSSQTVSSSFNNKDFTVELINSLAGKQKGISIPSVGFASEPLQITQSSYTAVSIVLGILLPGICVVTGAAVSIRRRRL